MTVIFEAVLPCGLSQSVAVLPESVSIVGRCVIYVVCRDGLAAALAASVARVPARHQSTVPSVTEDRSGQGRGAVSGLVSAGRHDGAVSERADSC